MTPAMFALISERHRESLVHREMTAALTTASVINSMCHLDKPIAWTDFAPNYKGFQSQSTPGNKLSDTQRKMIHDHNQRAFEMEIKLREEWG
jgi:hypothetical protein